MPKLSRDLTTPPGGTALLHPRETIFATGVLAAINAELPIPVDGCASIALDLRGTFSMTLEVSGTVDGTNWTLIPMRAVNLPALQYVAAITGAVQGTWVGKCAPFRSVRVRCTAFTSGSVTATLAGDTAPLDDSLSGMVTPLISTNTGAAGAAVTLTIAAPGVGLRQYLTYLAIVRTSSLVLTAAAAPTVITTTNLPNALAFTMGVDAAAIGVDKAIREDWAFPLAAAAQNTAVTIVAPLLLGAIWRITAGYYVAP